MCILQDTVKRLKAEEERSSELLEAKNEVTQGLAQKRIKKRQWKAECAVKTSELEHIEIALEEVLAKLSDKETELQEETEQKMSTLAAVNQYVPVGYSVWN